MNICWNELNRRYAWAENAVIVVPNLILYLDILGKINKCEAKKRTIKKVQNKTSRVNAPRNRSRVLSSVTISVFGYELEVHMTNPAHNFRIIIHTTCHFSHLALQEDLPVTHLLTWCSTPTFQTSVDSWLDYSVTLFSCCNLIRSLFC